MRRAVVEQRELARAGFLGDVDRVLDGAVTPRALDLVLVGGVLRVVDEQVDAVAELEHVAGYVVVGVVGHGAGPVVGEVRDRHALHLDPEAERGVGVADPARPHLGAVEREVVVGDRLEGDVAAQLLGRDREVGRAHHLAEHGAERPVLLVGTDHGDVATAGRERQEERQPLDVIPVEVGEQHRGAVAVEASLGGQRVAVVAQPGAEVEHDRVVAFGRDFDARGVAPVAVELVAVARSRTAHPPEVHVRRSGHTSEVTWCEPVSFRTLRPETPGQSTDVTCITSRSSSD